MRIMHKKSDQATPESAWLAVVQAYQTCSRQYERMLAHFELTIPQFDALIAIRRLGDDAQPMHIATSMLVSRGNVSGVLQRLVERGLLERLPHAEDGRAHVLKLTSEGHQLADKAGAAAKLFVRTQLWDCTPAELQHTQDVMRRMRHHLEDMDPDDIAHIASTHKKMSARESA